MDEPTIEEIMDGIALMQEHGPQSPQDWRAVAQRWLDSGMPDPEHPSPLFGALYLAEKELRDLKASNQDRELS